MTFANIKQSGPSTLLLRLHLANSHFRLRLQARIVMDQETLQESQRDFVFQRNGWPKPKALAQPWVVCHQYDINRQAVV